ncbi:hypothetical protein T261_4032 [Streptomyces lydicus]|nr:hypothetical protein T261_4032 [Streptomyces lydicus]
MPPNKDMSARRRAVCHRFGGGAGNGALLFWEPWMPNDRS